MTHAYLLLVAMLSAPLVALSAADAPPPIDRQALVTRHNITLNDPKERLAVGNGKFCVGIDGTGLQTFTGNSMAHWAWHSFPLPAGVTPAMIPATGSYAKGRVTGPEQFPVDKAVRTWQVDNPHIMNLGRLRLVRADGTALVPGDLSGVQRTLDLWTGTQTTRYTVAGKPVEVVTTVHPKIDQVAVRITSPLVASGELKVALEFPYPTLGKNKTWVGDFDQRDGHTTIATHRGAGRVDFIRSVDATTYHASLVVRQGTIADPPMVKKGSQAWVASAQGSQVLALTCAYAATPLPADLPDVAATLTAGAAARIAMWKTGGAIDLSASRDPRWKELERRIVLSQHLMAVMSAGSWPSSENGLYGIDSWRGHFHMEMVWWHLAHYALWDRWDMGAEAIACYQRFMPQARALAEQQGYQGLKWGKSVGPEGRTAPWSGNQALLWKQPHPIFFAELEYRLRPTRATLDKWAAIIEGTATQMADYATKDAATGRYSLAVDMPPCEMGWTHDGVFDLAYWRWGLDQAQKWRERLGQPRNPHWDEVRQNLTPLPVLDGCFIHSPEWTDTYTARAKGHPDPIGVFGMLPATPGVDQTVAANTVRKVWTTWNWKSKVWGWDFPWMAMAAARTGQPLIAVDALLKDSEHNAYPSDGMCSGWYLPGNGGLLYAVAMMAAGWDGAPVRNAPGFPDDGSWTVHWEGLKKAP